jgi:hypothetical protein
MKATPSGVAIVAAVVQLEGPVEASMKGDAVGRRDPGLPWSAPAR